jgi:hypothetical protein
MMTQPAKSMTEREAYYALRYTLRLAELSSSLRASIQDEQDLLFAAGLTLKRIRQFDSAWCAHPSYEDCNSRDPLNPHVRAVFKHPPGRGGKEFSFVIGSMQDLISPQNIRWATRSLGDFHCLAPMESDTPVHPHKILSLSYSLNGAGFVFTARMRLKELLPKHLHRFISEARRVNRKPKHWFLSSGDPATDKRLKESQPEWYRKKSKGELWVELGLKEQDRKEIRLIMDPLDFWECATGRVHPDDIESRLNQLRLFQIKLVARKG